LINARQPGSSSWQIVLPARRASDQRRRRKSKGVFMLHKFQIGQRVRYAGNMAQRHAIGGGYEVTGQMPPRDGDNQYRIKREVDPHQRVVGERELQPDARDAAVLFEPRH
jgi:hypothetical protein